MRDCQLQHITVDLHLRPSLLLEKSSRNHTSIRDYLLQELGKLGYKYQFVTLAGFHALNFGMFELACGYKKRGMAAYSELQQQEFAAEGRGYTATKHQREVSFLGVCFMKSKRNTSHKAGANTCAMICLMLSTMYNIRNLSPKGLHFHQAPG